MSGGNGLVTITGDGSKLIAKGFNFAVGAEGEGRLNVENRGKVEGKSLAIGQQSTGQGFVTVTGEESKVVIDGDGPIELDGYLSVGVHGEGALVIESGGMVQGRTIDIGSATTDEGFVHVTGTNSRFLARSSLPQTAPSKMLVGNFTTGVLLIEDGGQAEADVIELGATGSGDGIVTVNGDFSRIHADLLRVGEQGDGRLFIEDTGAVYANDVKLANDPSSDGFVFITDDGSKFVVDGGLLIGVEGRGELKMEEGGNVWARSVGLGVDAGGNGEISVSDPGSELYVVDTVSIAHGGSGEISIESGGRMEVGRALEVYSAGELFIDQGNVTVGTRSLEGEDKSLDIGAEGTVTVDGGSIAIGDVPVTEGTVTIGADGRLHNDGMINGDVKVLEDALWTGSGQVNGDVSNDGTVDPGDSIDTLAIVGDYQQGSTGVMVIEIGGLFQPGSSYDLVQIEGDANIQGTIELRFVNGFLPAQNDMFCFIEATGSFDADLADIEIVNLQDEFEYFTEFTDGAFCLTALVHGIPEPTSGLALLVMASATLFRRR